MSTPSSPTPELATTAEQAEAAAARAGPAVLAVPQALAALVRRPPLPGRRSGSRCSSRCWPSPRPTSCPATSRPRRSGARRRRRRRRSCASELGLDRPLYEQYLDWISGVAQGDLGTSLAARRPVTDVLGDRFRNSALLALLALLIMVPLAFVLGVLAGIRAPALAGPHHLRHGRSPSSRSRSSSSAPCSCSSSPSTRGWLPSVSLVAARREPAVARPRCSCCRWPRCSSRAWRTCMRMIRAGMVEVMASDYVEMARLNGVAGAPRGRAVRAAQRARAGRAGARADAAVARRRRRRDRGAVRLSRHRRGPGAGGDRARRAR